MIRNFTPHEVRVLKAEACEFVPAMRKYVLKDGIELEEATLTVIKPEGRLLNATFADEDAEPINGIPTIRRKVASLDPLPEGNDFCIVSALYASACEEKGRILTVGDVVYTKDGRTPIGCLRLIRY